MHLGPLRKHRTREEVLVLILISPVQFAIPGSICAQNTTKQSICEAGLAELKPNEQYFFWVANGCGCQFQSCL